MSLIDWLFGCTHARYSFPRTPRRPHQITAATVTGTYVACLDCGKELAYSWKEMRVVSGKTVEPVESIAISATSKNISS